LAGGDMESYDVPAGQPPNEPRARFGVAGVVERAARGFLVSREALGGDA
jgi:hypothetical protein